jgi:hypothetical protein
VSNTSNLRLQPAGSALGVPSARQLLPTVTGMRQTPAGAGRHRRDHALDRTFAPSNPPMNRPDACAPPLYRQVVSRTEGVVVARVANITARGLVPAGVVALLIAASGAGCQNRAALPPSGVDGAPIGSYVGGESTKAPMTFTVEELVGDVRLCAAGYEHPNVCCHRGACSERPNAPFAPCDDDALTFPDRGRCCSLDRPGDCVGASDADAGVDVDPRRCALPCSPGAKTAADANFEACTNDLGGGCVYCCEGLGCPSSTCRCPPGPFCPADAPPGSCPPAKPCACNTPRCNACPAGWSSGPQQFDLCCRGTASGSPQCFSQAVAINRPADGGGMVSGPNGCEIYNVMDGVSYDLACDVTKTPQCTCSLDGVPTMSFPFANVSCALTTCGFPAWPVSGVGP